jgi:hypothetical protein
MKKYCSLFLLLLMVPGLLNFLTFWIISAAIGGDAFNGKYEQGHFYLGSHGALTEVTESLFVYSKWHARSLLLTHPIAMISIYFWERMKGKAARARSWESRRTAEASWLF